MFKWIGLGLGLISMGILGGLLGYFIGSVVDRVQSLGIGGANPLTQKHRQTVFLDTLFVLKGKLAKADGHVSQTEIDHVEAFIKQVGLSAQHRQEAIQQFKKGVAPDFDIRDTLTEFMAHCGHTFNLRQMLLTYLIVMALADGRIDDSEHRLLLEIAQQLRFSQTEFEQLLKMVLGQTQFGGSGRQTSQRSSASALSDAYQALGVQASDTDQQIKRAYRKLMSQHHPDKLMGQGVPEDMIQVATEKAKEIQLAYDLIKQHRGIK
jgi:DnaJ like chaperone protein